MDHNDNIAWPVPLSSRDVWGYRLGWPILMFFVSGTFVFVGLTQVPPLILVGVGLFVASVSFTMKFLWKLKVVIAYPDYLEISDFRNTIELPYEQIRLVTHKRGSVFIVKLFLNEPSQFGMEIIFIAYDNFATWIKFWQPHPAVKIIESRRNKALTADTSTES